MSPLSRWMRGWVSGFRRREAGRDEARIGAYLDPRVRKLAMMAASRREVSVSFMVEEALCLWMLRGDWETELDLKALEDELE